MVRRFAIGIVLVVAATPWSSSAHSSRAASEPTTTVYLPNITKMLGGPDGWQTPFIVQNVGDGPTDITMDFYGGGEGRFFKTRTVTGVAPGTSVVHDPNGDPDLGAGWAGSVVVRSFGAPIVAVVNEHQNVRDAVRQEALSYSGISAGSTMLFLPYLTRSAGGWLTTFIVQNMGASVATATVQFQTFEGPPMLSLPLSMAPGRSQFVDLRFTGGLVDGLEYSAVITSDQPIGAVVNAHHDAPGTADPMGFSYNGIPASSARARRTFRTSRAGWTDEAAGSSSRTRAPRRPPRRSPSTRSAARRLSPSCRSRRSSPAWRSSTATPRPRRRASTRSA